MMRGRLPVLFIALMVAAPLAWSGSLVSFAAVAGCPETFETNLNGTSGPLTANAAPCASSASVTVSYGQISGSASSSSSGYAWANGQYDDIATITNGPSSGYLRIFHSFTYSVNYSAPGLNGQGINVLGHINQQGWIGVNSTTSGSWNQSISGWQDFQFSGIGSIAPISGRVQSVVACPYFGCSGDFTFNWQVTGWQVLDQDYQVDSDAIITTESGALYQSTVPEPATWGLVVAAATALWLCRQRNLVGIR